MGSGHSIGHAIHLNFACMHWTEAAWMVVSGIPLSISGAYNYQNFGNSLMVTFVVLDDHLGFTLLGNAYCVWADALEFLEMHKCGIEKNSRV